MKDASKPGSDELATDVLGFGARELVTARDLLLRPGVVLEAWMIRGADGGGHYARPLRLYLALNAILMLILFLCGGAAYMLEGLPAGLIDPLVARSGKSMDAFIADADGWMTLFMVPLLSLFYALATVPLFRLWDREDLGWRRGFRAAFGWLCAWTVPVVPLAWWAYGRGPTQTIMGAVILLLGAIAFVRMGRGRWFISLPMGLVKAIVLSMAIQAAGMVGFVLVIGIGLLGASVTP